MIRTRNSGSHAIVLIMLMIGFINITAMTGYADGCSGANFKGARDHLVGQYPYALVAADFNNDGKSDVAAADYYGNNVRVAFGDGAGGFSSVSTYASGLKPIAIAAGNLNSDGRADIVVSNYDSNEISVLLNDGSGNFTVTNYAAGVGPGEIVLADINDDTMMDVMVTNQTSGAILFFPNNGTGGLLALGFVTLPPSSNPKDIVSADFNHDGKADLATANAVGSISVILRTGAGTFGSPTTSAVPGVGDLQAIAFGDFTGDSELDLVVVSYNQSVVRLLQGNGAGAFMVNPPVSFTVVGNPVNVYLRDINADGKLDIEAVSSSTTTGNSTVRVFYGNGLGGVTSMSDVLIGASARSLAITDVNGDSKLDVVTNFITLLSAGLSVSLNDGAGQLETASLIGTPGAISYKISDFNLDGRPDLAFANGSVKVRLGLPNGELAAETNYVTSGAEFLDVGDFNQDGWPDIATANGLFLNVTVFLNNGSGGFLAGTNYSVGGSVRSLAIGDFTGDGKLDLAVTANSLGAVRIFTGNGMGSFLLTGTTSLNANPVAIVTGDFNTDGNLDVITANECIVGGCTGKLLTYFPGTGAGGFTGAVDLFTQTPPMNTTSPGISRDFLARADFNGDGRLDITWARSNPGSVFTALQVALNTGGGTFAMPVSVSGSTDNLALAAGDVNGDGKQDIVTIGREIQFILGQGAGSFAPPVNYTGFGSALAFGDINGDGKRDVVFSGDGGMRRLLNKCALSRSISTTDFDGDGITDISVFRPSTGAWYLLYSSDGSFHAIQFGTMGDIPVAGDYDGDGKTDVAVFRPSNGVWYHLRSSDGSFRFQQFGTNGDVPVPGDYDGDGMTNFAVWRPSTGYWYTSLNPATNFGAVLWGATTDKPVQADYDGDGRTDVAVFRPSTATWYVLRSSLGYQEQQFGIANDTPVPSDFDGDGKANFAVFRQTTGWWYSSLNPATNYGGVLLGQSGDNPVPGFYDGDGRADAAVFRTGDWYIRQSNTGSVVGTHFGSSGDEPAPSAIRHP